MCKLVTRLELIDVCKSFAAKRVLSNISFSLSPGSVTAIVGENGAGKSTLMNLIFGLLQKDSGSTLWNGKEVDITSPGDARKLGIGMVMQHFALFESMSVLENLYLHLSVSEKVDKAGVLSRAEAMSKKFAFTFNFNQRVSKLSIGDRQRLEIFKCLLQGDLQLLILDEPTSMLTLSESEKLIGLLRKLAEEGCSILYISHKIKEVLVVADNAVVLRKGLVVSEYRHSDIDEAVLVSDLVGDKPLSFDKRQNANQGSESLILKSIDTTGATFLRRLNLEAKGGEILGIAGVSGNGQEALVDVISGELAVDQGMIAFAQQDMTSMSLKQRYQLGVTGIVSDRNTRSSVGDHSLLESYYLKYRLKNPSQLIDWRKIKEKSEQVIQQFQVNGCSSATQIGELSGGNRQKFIVGRELSMDPKLVVCHQATWGLDIQSAKYLHHRFRSLADKGAIVILISEDIEELYLNCDKLAVLHNGELSPAKDIEDFSLLEAGKWLSGIYGQTELEAS